MTILDVLRSIGRETTMRDGEAEKIDRLIERLDNAEQDIDNMNEALEIFSYYAKDFSFELSEWKVSVAIVQGARQKQEDTFDIRLFGPGITAFAVFDGHGGASVSTCARNIFLRKLESKIADEDTIEDAMRVAFKEFGDEVSDHEPGSTATVVVIDQRPGRSTFTVGNVGDSPCVIHTTDGKIKRVSVDHKPSNPQENKRIQADGGYIIFNRLNSRLAVSQAFGDSTIGKGLSYEGSYLTLDLENIDCFFLGSDGVSDAFSDEEAMCVVMDSSIDYPEMAKRLVEGAVMRRKYQADNTTAIVLRRVLPEPVQEEDSGDMSLTAPMSTTDSMDDDLPGLKDGISSSDGNRRKDDQLI